MYVNQVQERGAKLKRNDEKYLMKNKFLFTTHIHTHTCNVKILK